jgi:hypothetical protein
MTSDGISTADWQRVHALAVEVANATDEDHDRQARQVLRSCLRELRARYGEKPSILATEADYADAPEESRDLLLRAFDLATELSDTSNMKEISLSLADLYVTEFRDVSAARYWLSRSQQWIDPTSDIDWKGYDAVHQAILSTEEE